MKKIVNLEIVTTRGWKKIVNLHVVTTWGWKKIVNLQVVTTRIWKKIVKIVNFVVVEGLQSLFHKCEASCYDFICDTLAKISYQSQVGHVKSIFIS